MSTHVSMPRRGCLYKSISGCVVFILLPLLYLLFGFSSHRQELRPSGLFTSIELSDYGWLGLKKSQSIDVQLAETALLQDVVDLSIFGHLRPGMNHREAMAAEGPPESEFRDSEGQLWHVYRPAGVAIHVGCPCIGSGEWDEICVWRLRAPLPDSLVSQFLKSGAISLLQRGRREKPEVGYREISIRTTDGERVDLTLDRANGQVPSLSWLNGRDQWKHGRCAAASNKTNAPRSSRSSPPDSSISPNAALSAIP